MRLFKKKVLIVGGAGFIGSRLVTELGHSDIVDLKYKNEPKDFLRMKPLEYDVIVFLAVDMHRSQEAYTYNGMLYANLDDWLEEYPKTHVIYTSSAAVYPDIRKKQSERDLVAPANWYGMAKLLGECHVQQYRYHTILRLSNVCGEGGHGAMDLFKDGGTTIYGTGKQVRDYVNVNMVTMVIAEAIKNKRQWQGITNVSSGFGQTTLEIFRRHGSGNPEFVKAREGDQKYSVLDNTKMQRIIWNR